MQLVTEKTTLPSSSTGCSGSGACTTMEAAVGSGQLTRLALFALSYLIMPKHGCWKNSDLILQLLWNFPSLTSFNCCNSTSQSKKPWNFFYTCLQEQGFIIMQNFYIFVISPRLSFPTDEGCISVGFVSTFCLRRGLDAGTQVGAVGAQHFPAGFGT